MGKWFSDHQIYATMKSLPIKNMPSASSTESLKWTLQRSPACTAISDGAQPDVGEVYMDSFAQWATDLQLIQSDPMFTPGAGKRWRQKDSIRRKGKALRSKMIPNPVIASSRKRVRGYLVADWRDILEGKEYRRHARLDELRAEEDALRVLLRSARARERRFTPAVAERAALTKDVSARLHNPWGRTERGPTDAA